MGGGLLAAFPLAYAGGWLDWLSPFSVLTGVALVIGYTLLVGAAVIVPLILIYTAWAYWVFRGKVGTHGYH